MFGNGRIFISHTHEDNQRCQPLLAALDAWQVTYWFDLQELDAGQRFSDRIQQALDQSDIFLRISTTAAERSFWMDRELRAARGLRSAIPDHPRLIIHLVLGASGGVIPVSTVPREIVIDASTGPRALWLKELRQALGAGAPRRVSRRTAISVGVASVAAVATTALAAKVFLTPTGAAANPFHPKGVPYLPTPEAGALPVRWQYTLNFNAPAESGIPAQFGTPDLYVGLAADSGALYALSPTSQVLLAMSLRDSSILWLYPDQSATPRSTITGSTVATAGGKIFLLTELDVIGGSSTINLICLEPAKGTVVWKTPDLVGPSGLSSPASVSNLCVANSAIYFHMDGKLYGFSQNGNSLWPPVPLPSFNSIQQSVSTPVYANGLVVVGTNDGRLLAVNAATGAVTWSIQVTTGTFAAIQSSPVAAGGFIYLGATDGYCYAFTAATGSLAWKSQLVNLATYNQFITSYFAAMGAPLVANGRVYLQAGVNNDGTRTQKGLLFALDAGTGKQLWKVDPTKLALPLHIPTVTGIPNIRPWYSSGSLIYTTLGFISSNASPPVELASIETLLALNQQDGSLHSYFLAPVDGQSLSSGYFPSAPVPVPGGIAYMTNEPEIYVLDV